MFLTLILYCITEEGRVGENTLLSFYKKMIKFYIYSLFILAIHYHFIWLIQDFSLSTTYPRSSFKSSGFVVLNDFVLILFFISP